MKQKMALKYFVVFILFLGNMVASLDRSVMSIALIPMTEQFGLSASATGIILSSFFLGFTLLQIPAGYAADRWGSRVVLLLSVASWSVFTGLTGLVWSLSSILLIRFLFGACEAFYPSASSISIAENFPLNQRARAKTIVLLGNGVGAVLSAVIGTALIDSIGWRWLFGMLAILGVIIFILFWLVLADRGKGQEIIKAPVNKVPMRQLLKTPLVWTLMLTSFGIYIVNWGIASWMPIYLVKARGLSRGEMGTLIALSGLVMMVMGYVIGHILDKITGKERYVASGGAVLAAIFIYLMANAATPVMVVVFQTLAQIACTFVTFTVLTQPMKRFPKAAMGSANGIINMGGQVGSFISPMAMGFIIDSSGGSYTTAFLFLAACVVISAVSGATIPVIKSQDEAPQLEMG